MLNKSPRRVQARRPHNQTLMPSIKMVVASTSPIYEEAVRIAMEEVYCHTGITIVQCPTESTVSRQPIGIEETMRGAQARLDQVSAIYADGIIVSIENGLVEGFDLAVVKMRRLGRVRTALSAGVQVSSKFLPTEGMTVGESVAKWCGCDPSDPDYELTTGYRPRAKLIADAIVIAWTATQSHHE